MIELHTNAIDRDTLRNPLVDVAAHAVDLAVVGTVEVVVVDVELGRGIRLTGSLESDGNEFLAKDSRVNRVSQGSVLVEDLVDDVLAS